MAIPWSNVQRRRVSRELARLPPQSGRCQDAARGILPVAREVDPSACGILIKPAGRARYVLPKVALAGSPWRFHVTVQATQHYVDALTGADGTPIDSYFDEHWKYSEPEAYEIAPVDLTEHVP